MCFSERNPGELQVVRREMLPGSKKPGPFLLFGSEAKDLKGMGLDEGRGRAWRQGL